MGFGHEHVGHRNEVKRAARPCNPDHATRAAHSGRSKYTQAMNETIEENPCSCVAVPTLVLDLASGRQKLGLIVHAFEWRVDRTHDPVLANLIDTDETVAPSSRTTAVPRRSTNPRGSLQWAIHAKIDRPGTHAATAATRKSSTRSTAR